MDTTGLLARAILAGKHASSSRVLVFYTFCLDPIYDYTASKSRIIMSGQVRKCKIVVKRLEEPGFSARAVQVIMNDTLSTTLELSDQKLKCCARNRGGGGGETWM